MNINTDFNKDGEEVTCSEMCHKQGVKDTYKCCRYCLEVNDCEEKCFFVEDNLQDDNCELEWAVKRCYKCKRIIMIDEEDQTFSYKIHGNYENIVLCKNCDINDLKE